MIKCLSSKSIKNSSFIKENVSLVKNEIMSEEDLNKAL